ncbi:hypothetical protein PUNSTDRAFT_102931 [Punctularia strigosozonata HHB-11173 SS5]|uniref:uncharacterized protein n=1 Tax=Punctularia strigosozonata (strain HHB-11173) TaxID=741275 RepID=UPI0004416E20|nr:uncharacterized protein PUNSTDRAFT_102931 [Punctularia strigosozonata HHB-11173 SS5]EIN08169.1 hypothetical protein PUNSTDRAFT_102931 [Punctularia strigosozonata HHB-11173 SS5]
MERACFKVRRALDKLRRAAIKLVDRGDEKGSSVKEEVLGFLEKMIELLESTAKKVSVAARQDLVTPAIDTLFLLARIRLVPQRTSTIALSFELLSRALRLIGVTPSPNDERAANYLRCISGAYHNLACVLYQAGMHAYAIRFLVEGCRFGLKATRAHEDASRAKTPLMWKHEDAWVQLRGQLYRRWELLGACYSKIGDTKAAYNAYVHAITTYPFLEPPFLDLVESGNITKAFEASPASRQIGNIIDRVTYMATQDMFREPEDVPLTSAFEHAWPNGVESRFNLVIAAVLERQAESLIASRWKENVSIAILALLEAALAIYTPEKWPYRRARLLLKILETTYHTSAEPVRRRGRDFQQIGEEIQKLIAHSQDIGCDDVIRMYGDEYIVSAHLWISLHYHREQRVTDCLQSAQSAWDVSKRKFLHLSQRTPAKSMAAKGLSSPKRARAAPKGRTTTIKKGALPRPSIRPVVSARSKQSRTTTSRIKAKDPVTPKPRHVFEAPSRSPVTPPRKADAAVSTMVLDNPEKLLTLFDTTCQLIGLIGHISLRIRLLSVARRICESSLDSHIERFVKVSTELARNYATLGKSYKAALIFQQGADVISRFQTRVSTDVRLLFLLHHAATLALMDDIHTSAKLYCEAVALSSATKDEERGVSTSDRVRSRARRLVRTATASDVYAIIQSARAEPAESLSAMLRSLRLWNRAVEALSRLAPRPNDHNASRVSVIDGSEWAISEGLLLAMFSVSRMYLVRGSAREAQYFAQQTEELAMSLSAYAMIARALAGQAEIQLHLRQLEDAKNLISRAAAMVEDLPGIEAADIYRLHGDYNRLSARREDAHKLYTEATATLDGLAMSFSVIDALVTRPSTATVTKAEDSSFETLAPRLLSTILWQQIWLLRENVNDENYRVLLDRLLALPSSTDAEQNSLIAKLTLHDIFSRFRSDIYLSTLGETAIAIPMGMLSDKGTSPPASLQEVLGIFAGAEQLWWANLASTAMKGEVLRVRDGALSLASVQALQASLGQNPETGPIVAMRLLDIAASLTIRREMLEATRHKISELEAGDDLAWSLMTPNGSPLGPARNSTPKPSWDSDSEEDEDSNAEADGLSVYWKGIYGKYQQLPMDVSSLSSSQAEQLPDNWVVVNINLAEDRDTLYISRQRKGKDSLMFCLPLKGRRDSDEENHLTLDGAVAEMKDIVKLNDEGTRSAATVDVKDKQARVAWWAGRTELDQRLRDLLENIEFCWLGAFKTILSPAIAVNGGALAHFREGLEKVLKRGLNLRNKKEMSRLRLSDGLLECFSNLSPQCRDEELEDLVYFMLDLYQFHGVAVAVSEIDVDQVAVDLRSVLEEHAKRSGSPTTNNDSHLFLVLDKDLQGIPWESIPVLRGKSVSRIPCMEFLLDRLQFEDWQRSSVTGSSPKPNNKAADRATVDPRRTYYLLNPSGDLKGTQSRFSDWLETMRSVGWQGITGRPPSEQQFLDALNRKDLVIYFGHGGAEQYVRSHKVRHLSRCAATLLWGCSSGALKEMGDFDRVGTPYNYMVSGCPTLVANLWDVTDRDIDKFSQAVFDKLRLDPDHVKNWDGAEGGKVSLMEAVAKSRDVCKLKYLNGAAPVVYGIPFYL